jgi:RimJ/RimL family protein N-acetyltransferase
MVDAFRSRRLVYRAIEDNDEDIEFLHSLNLESEGRINGNASLFKPVNKKYAQELADDFHESFLCVLICLRISSETREEKGSDAAASKASKPIGRVRLWKVEEKYRHHRNANIGITIASVYQRKGYGSEAIKWVLNWAFQMAGLHRVGITCFSYNPEARKLYESLGFGMRAGRESHFGMMANGMIKSSSGCSRVSGKLGMRKRRLGVGAP